MKTWPILLACLTTCTLATQVTYQTSSSSQSSSSTNQQQQQWSWQGQDLLGAPNTQEESYHPVSFTAPDALKQEQSQQQQLYNPNVQSQSSGVGEALDQRTVDSVIDNILIYNRQGRNLEGYDELYADPDVKNALQLGNDTVARSYIKEKLCSLGLMNCENLEGRRPYYSPHRDIHPHDVIYAQPVTIKPVGHPLPAVPVKRPYRFGKPESLSPGFAPGSILSGPPPSFIGAGHGPIYSRPPSSFLGSQVGLKKPGGPIYATKPIYEPGLDAEVDFDDKFVNKKQVILQQPGGPVQQHVHHHYHHGDSTGNVGSTPIIGPGPIGNNGFNAYGYGNGGSYAGTINDFEDYRKNFKIKTSNSGNSLNEAASSNSYANAFSTYEKVKGDSTVGGSSSVHTGKQYPGFGNSNPYIVNNNFASNGNNFAGGLGSFENGFNNGLSSSNYEDCVCVPYEQCSTIDHVGRKDDLYLAIDPRNLDKNIEAETVEVVVTDGNGTMSIVRVPKGVNATDHAEHRREQDSNGQTPDSEENNDFVENDKRTKRDTVKRAEQKEENKAEAQSRLVVGDLDTSKLNVKPTWGVSFGLPQSYVNPINPFDGYGGQGINLGLVSVNPLVAIQVTKDEYGEKVVKPLVNLHVTPNPGLVHKLGHLLSHKKETLLGNYAPEYYPAGPVVYEKPIHPYPSKPYYPTIHSGPFYHEKPYHQNYHSGYHHNPHYQNGYTDYYRGDDDYDYEPDSLEDYNDYYRNARTNASYYDDPQRYPISAKNSSNEKQSRKIVFRDRKKRDVKTIVKTEERQFGRPPVCGPRHVCCRSSHIIASRPRPGQCGTRYTKGVNARIKTPAYVDGDSEFGEYPWQVAILKKDPAESVYVCGGTLISPRHIITAAHCVKTYAGRDLRARLGEWDVNHDVEFYPYIERDIVSVYVHPEFYAGTLYNDIAILKLDHPVDFDKNPHINPACLPNKRDDFNGARCWTTGWGKDAFGEFGKYQNILKEVDVPIINNQVCESQMRRTRLGASFSLHPGFICAGGEEGKDACKGDGGGPMVCERHGQWQLAGVVSWGIGCGQAGVPGVYSRVSFYLDWIRQVIDQY
ncbi:uncharacterized protein LOC122632874 isoform X1 [Vespula pensylvanica]|uniref:uncharacterized protein LOC122632874 isoform X1 n=1 Tax=Vespula pensylvanica TaxID=30213 RepID=UPI001CB9E0EF|nr:uncharacterized protein LOC122632874 isoform X1 [Vespula pensylvanica]